MNWEKAADSECALIAFRAYSKYSDGGVSEKDYLGIRFVCIEAGSTGVILGPDFYINSEDSASRLSLVGDTPEEALRLWCEAKSR